MKKTSTLLLFFLMIITVSIVASCDRDDFDYDQASAPLRFSRDTIVLDTVFSSNRSETYSLKVYNDQHKDITIPRIYLENLQASQYKINVDGASGFDFHNVPLRSRDSLYIMIEIAPQAISASQSIVEENLVFNTLSGTQKVNLISLVEDAEFFYSPAGGVQEISGDVVWDNKKSKVIYGQLKLVNGAKLTIEEGTKVYFHSGSGLTVEGGSEFIVNGTLGNEVTIRGDRHDAKYDSVAGYWNNIYLAPKSKASINYANIKGGKEAFIVDEGAELSINNTKIFNFSRSGIHSKGANIKGTNLVMNNCEDFNLLIENGGTYDFTHCTFANYANGRVYALSMSNKLEGGTVSSPLNAVFKNSIFWARGASSLYLDSSNLEEANYLFDTNLIKNNSTALQIEGNSHFVNTILNEDPLFNKTDYSANLLNLKENSPAFGKGNKAYATSVPTDITGISRVSNPTLGAYQN